MRFLSGVGVIVLWAAVATAQAPSNASTLAPEIVATGSGEVRLRPDRATVTIGVTTRATSAAAAGRQNVDRMLPLMAALRRQGLPDSALVTTGYSVSPERDPYSRATAPVDSPTVYVARNALRVTLTDLDALGQVLDTALASGASETTNIVFASSRAAEARQRAVALAVRAARADAEAAAAAAGGTLGPLIELSLDQRFVAGGMAASYLEQSGYAPDATPISPRDVSVTVQVRTRYHFVRSP